MKSFSFGMVKYPCEMFQNRMPLDDAVVETVKKYSFKMNLMLWLGL